MQFGQSCFIMNPDCIRIIRLKTQQNVAISSYELELFEKWRNMKRILTYRRSS